MDAKDLRTLPALSDHKDGSKYSQSGVTVQCNRNKSYQDIGCNPLGKAESAAVRPCAVIGPDRVLPPPVANDAFAKKGPIETWPCPDNVYSQLPDYQQRIVNNQNQMRNISPRQTYQENMQRILVPPTYSSIKNNSDSSTFNHAERTSVLSKNTKPNNMAPEAKYCDVPYSVNQLSNEQKNVRDPQLGDPSANPTLMRAIPHGWPPNSANVHGPRSYGAHDLYQYQQYQSCAGPRPTVLPVARPQRPFQEEAGYVYPEPYYQDPSVRFKPYPQVKDRYPQTRFDYIGNYSNHFHPPPTFPPHKYDIPKPGTGPIHHYPMYPHLKYLENRPSDPTLEAYQRHPNQLPPGYNMSFRNQLNHPSYPPGLTNAQSKLISYQVDSSGKPLVTNKMPYENNNKVFIDYETARNKPYTMNDAYMINEINRAQPVKGQIMPPSYPTNGIHPVPTQQFFRKDIPMKSHEYLPHFRNFDPSVGGYSMIRHSSQFSPNAFAISPTDSNTSNDTTQTQATNQEDCGYVSQSSTASARSVESGINRMTGDYYRKPEYRYGPVGNSLQAKHDAHKNKKQIDVRQFLQMWNEGDDDNGENNTSKEVVNQAGNHEMNNYSKKQESKQEQLYVLGLVNVPSEELSKYEHIQKVSKLPENIKGYNSIELLKQFEEAIECSSAIPHKPTASKEFYMPMRGNRNAPKQVVGMFPRPLSPLDVESKISQSVIHKEVGCNFEIKPCSPKMLNVEIPAPVQNVLGERAIEKVSNPLSKIKSPLSMQTDDNVPCRSMKRQDPVINYENSSCKVLSSPYSAHNLDNVKTDYSIQDLETNSGICLASLPRLDNEIELNFPEVNQQFIDANKIDKISLNEKNLSGTTQPQINSPEVEGLKPNISDFHLSDGSLLDGTDYSKLSKYRKMKNSLLEIPEINVNAVRTDSVIIENPENPKRAEFKKHDYSQSVKENNLSPINLTSHLKMEEDNFKDITCPQNNAENVETDLAIDFSLNKPDILSDKKSLQTVDSSKKIDSICEDRDVKQKEDDDHLSPIDTLDTMKAEYRDTIIMNELNAKTDEENKKDFSLSFKNLSNEITSPQRTTEAENKDTIFRNESNAKTDEQEDRDLSLSFENSSNEIISPQSITEAEHKDNIFMNESIAKIDKQHDMDLSQSHTNSSNEIISPQSIAEAEHKDTIFMNESIAKIDKQHDTDLSLSHTNSTNEIISPQSITEAEHKDTIFMNESIAKIDKQHDTGLSLSHTNSTNEIISPQSITEAEHKDTIFMNESIARIDKQHDTDLSLSNINSSNEIIPPQIRTEADNKDTIFMNESNAKIDKEHDTDLSNTNSSNEIIPPQIRTEADNKDTIIMNESNAKIDKEHDTDLSLSHTNSTNEIISPQSITEAEHKDTIFMNESIARIDKQHDTDLSLSNINSSNEIIPPQIRTEADNKDTIIMNESNAKIDKEHDTDLSLSNTNSSNEIISPQSRTEADNKDTIFMNESNAKIDKEHEIDLSLSNTNSSNEIIPPQIRTEEDNKDTIIMNESNAKTDEQHDSDLLMSYENSSNEIISSQSTTEAEHKGITFMNESNAKTDEQHDKDLSLLFTNSPNGIISPQSVTEAEHKDIIFMNKLNAKTDEENNKDTSLSFRNSSNDIISPQRITEAEPERDVKEKEDPNFSTIDTMEAEHRDTIIMNEFSATTDEQIYKNLSYINSLNDGPKDMSIDNIEEPNEKRESDLVDDISHSTSDNCNTEMEFETVVTSNLDNALSSKTTSDIGHELNTSLFIQSQENNDKLPTHDQPSFGRSLETEEQTESEVDQTDGNMENHEYFETDNDSILSEDIEMPELSFHLEDEPPKVYNDIIIPDTFMNNESIPTSNKNSGDCDSFDRYMTIGKPNQEFESISAKSVKFKKSNNFMKGLYSPQIRNLLFQVEGFIYSADTNDNENIPGQLNEENEEISKNGGVTENEDMTKNENEDIKENEKMTENEEITETEDATEKKQVTENELTNEEINNALEDCADTASEVTSSVVMIDCESTKDTESMIAEKTDSKEAQIAFMSCHKEYQCVFAKPDDSVESQLKENCFPSFDEDQFINEKPDCTTEPEIDKTEFTDKHCVSINNTTVTEIIKDFDDDNYYHENNIDKSMPRCENTTKSQDLTLNAKLTHIQDDVRSETKNSIEPDSIDETDACTIRLECIDEADNGEIALPEFTNQHFNTTIKRNISLKRSLSDSALNSYTQERTWPSKRRKTNESNLEENLINENLCKLIQNARRNSISSINNVENVSFCILIDDSCILTEGSEQEKICFAEIQENNDTNESEENIVLQNVIRDENVFIDSSTYENESMNEATWVEDIACVETVVCDDMTDDVFVSSPLSPKHNYVETEVNEEFAQDMVINSQNDLIETELSDGIAEDVVISSPSYPKSGYVETKVTDDLREDIVFSSLLKPNLVESVVNENIAEDVVISSISSPTNDLIESEKCDDSDESVADNYASPKSDYIVSEVAENLAEVMGLTSPSPESNHVASKVSKGNAEYYDNVSLSPKELLESNCAGNARISSQPPSNNIVPVVTKDVTGSSSISSPLYLKNDCLETAISNVIKGNMDISYPSTPQDICFKSDNMDYDLVRGLDTSSPSISKQTFDRIDVNNAVEETVSSSSSSECDPAEYDEYSSLCDNLYKHTKKIKSIYRDRVTDNHAQIIDTLFRTSKPELNETLRVRDDLLIETLSDNGYLDKLSKSGDKGPRTPEYCKPRIDLDDTLDLLKPAKSDEDVSSIPLPSLRLCSSNKIKRASITEHVIPQDNTVNSCESTTDNILAYEDSSYTSSSPEVSSTTSEERNSSILLKITNLNGARISQINEIKSERKSRCKFTENKVYSNSNFPNRPLITKAAQKYIPPIKETIRDLKVKISLPQQSLLKLKQLKLSKAVAKGVNKQSSSNVPKISKKPKPNFEDVLKSIDEIQIKMHKEKNKKPKTTVPKVVIKKNEYGSHYTSTPTKESFNPDLTGRKWQPWVFLEKNSFIDNMALQNKTKAVFNHRKNTYVLAEKFKKYKSVATSTKFVISQPNSNKYTGQLKYTIRLKHNY